MDKSVDTLGSNENTEVRDVADLPANNRTAGVTLLTPNPRVSFDLLHTQRNTFGFDVDVENDTFYNVTDGDDLGRMLDTLRPAHFGNVDQTLNSVLQLNKGAVISEAYDLTLYAPPGNARSRTKDLR